MYSAVLCLSRTLFALKLLFCLSSSLSAFCPTTFGVSSEASAPLIVLTVRLVMLHAEYTMHW